MDLFRRFFGSHNSQPAPKNGPSDPTGHGNQLSLTVLFRRRWLKLEIGQSGERGDDEPTAAEPDIAVAEGEASGDLARIVPPQAQADERLPDMGEPAQQDATTVSFWDALDPTEREALRSIADWRTFAAGAVLMQEGDRADHVIVILGGRTKICVDEHGHERVLAVRGVGQLVGERGALQVSVRSATVIALDMVWALVVQTKDFAIFLSIHRRALALVQAQRYDRRTGESGGSERPAEYIAEPVSQMANVIRPDHGLLAEQSRQDPQQLNGENCTVFLSDVVAFGSRIRNDKDRLIIRDALFSMTNAALHGIPGAQSEDRGDGLLTVVPPEVSTTRAMEQLLAELPIALERHNITQRASARFQLRFAINVGPVVSDAMGVSGEAIIVAARLIEAPFFKDAVKKSAASFGLVVSPFVYETVIRHGSSPSDVASYSQVHVEVKESDTTAWMRLFDTPIPSFLVPHPTAPDSYLGPLIPSGQAH